MVDSIMLVSPFADNTRCLAKYVSFSLFPRIIVFANLKHSRWMRRWQAVRLLSGVLQASTIGGSQDSNENSIAEGRSHLELSES